MLRTVHVHECGAGRAHTPDLILNALRPARRGAARAHYGIPSKESLNVYLKGNPYVKSERCGMCAGIRARRGARSRRFRECLTGATPTLSRRACARAPRRGGGAASLPPYPSRAAPAAVPVPGVPDRAAQARAGRARRGRRRAARAPGGRPFVARRAGRRARSRGRRPGVPAPARRGLGRGPREQGGGGGPRRAAPPRRRR